MARALARTSVPTCRTWCAIQSADVPLLVRLLSTGDTTTPLGSAESVLLAQVEIDAAMLQPPQGLFRHDDEARSLSHRSSDGSRYGRLVWCCARCTPI